MSLSPLRFIPHLGSVLRGGLWIAFAWFAPNGWTQSPTKAGPLWASAPLVLEDGQQVQAFGPIWEVESREDQDKWALRPFLSHRFNRAEDHDQWHVLYPLITHNRFGTEWRTQILQWINWGGGEDSQDGAETKQTIFPLYFRKKSPNPEESYWALIPIYGTLKNRLFKKEIHVVFFPLYARTERGDATTHNFLYPFFHLRRGEHLRGFQIFPLLGIERKESQRRIDHWGEPVVDPGHFKAQAAWPLLFYENRGLGTEAPERERIVFPIFRSLRSPDRDATTVLWPFFNHIVDREKGYEEWQLPWPFLVFANGEGKTVRRVFPFFSVARNETHRSSFFLWPLFKRNRVVDPPLDRQRDRIFFSLFSNTRLTNTQTGATQVRRSIWPLFTTVRDDQGRSRTSALSIMEPLFPTDRDLAWNYSALWTLWKSERNPVTDQARQSALWNLYERERQQESRRTSFLFGLFQRERNETGTSTRIFYLPKIENEGFTPSTK